MSSARIPPQAAHDEHMVVRWLFGRSLRTQRAYRDDVDRFLTVVGTALPSVTLGDVRAYAGTLSHLSPATRARRMASMKSLLSKAHKRGYIPFNPGTALEVGTVKNRIGERILTEEQVQRLLALEPNRRNHALLRLRYACPETFDAD